MNNIEMNVERKFLGCASPSHRVAGSIGKYFPTVGVSRIDLSLAASVRGRFYPEVFGTNWL